MPDQHDSLISPITLLLVLPHATTCDPRLCRQLPICGSGPVGLSSATLGPRLLAVNYPFAEVALVVLGDLLGIGDTSWPTAFAVNYPLRKWPWLSWGNFGDWGYRRLRRAGVTAQSRRVRVIGNQAYTGGLTSFYSVSLRRKSHMLMTKSFLIVLERPGGVRAD